MKVALFADIHGNAVALDTVLGEINREDPDKLVCLGDIAATGPEPVAAVERLREAGCPVILGNADEDWLIKKEIPGREPEEHEDHEVFAIRDWTAAQLSPAHQQFIKSFEDTIEITLADDVRLLCYHGSPDSPWEPIDVNTPEERLDEIAESTDADILVGGHTHNQMVRRYRDVTFVNTGSVGLAFGTPRLKRDHNWPWGEWVLVTTSNGSISVDLRRTRLDVEVMFQAARESELPNSGAWIEGWRTGK